MLSPCSEDDRTDARQDVDLRCRGRGRGSCRAVARACAERPRGPAGGKETGRHRRQILRSRHQGLRGGQVWPGHPVALQRSLPRRAIQPADGKGALLSRRRLPQDGQVSPGDFRSDVGGLAEERPRRRRSRRGHGSAPGGLYRSRSRQRDPDRRRAARRASRRAVPPVRCIGDGRTATGSGSGCDCRSRSSCRCRQRHVVVVGHQREKRR